MHAPLGSPRGPGKSTYRCRGRDHAKGSHRICGQIRSGYLRRAFRTVIVTSAENGTARNEDCVGSVRCIPVAAFPRDSLAARL